MRYLEQTGQVYPLSQTKRFCARNRVLPQQPISESLPAIDFKIGV